MRLFQKLLKLQNSDFDTLFFDIKNLPSYIREISIILKLKDKGREINSSKPRAKI